MRTLVFIRDMMGIIGVLATIYLWSGLLDHRTSAAMPTASYVLATR